MMRQSDAVESLFNDKAPAWSAKYAPDGPLFQRLRAFGDRLRALVAPPADVLDFGCGTGNLARYLSGEGYRVSACDVCRKYLKAYDGRNASRPVMVAVDTIATLPLDAAAMQRGYVG